MGGRLDCTNIIRPDLCVITNIGLDHTQYLGGTLEKIAEEKAGIIKEGVPVVIGRARGAGEKSILRESRGDATPPHVIRNRLPRATTSLYIAIRNYRKKGTTFTK